MEVNDNKSIILILGGYGVFGQKIAQALAENNTIKVIIAGRDIKKARKFATDNNVSYAEIDVYKNIKNNLSELNPNIVINCCGPFQNQDYSVILSCIEFGAHYIDLADARDYVTGITKFDKEAKSKNLTIISGASTVPALSSAVIERYKNKFSKIDSLVYGITPGAKSPRGLATAKAILSYLGKPIKKWQGCNKIVYGWQDLYSQIYPVIGVRWMANCDVPDLDLLPERYQIKNIKFSAGMENKFLHFSMWFASWIVRLGLKIELTKYAEFLLNFSRIFDRFGTDSGGMHMIIKGIDNNNLPSEIKWFIIAHNNDGPNIPTIPAIILAKKLANNEFNLKGAMPCVGLISIEEYMNELKKYSIKEIIV